MNCDKCYGIDGMEVMAQGDCRLKLAKLAIEYYESENFLIAYRGHSDHQYELFICRHNQPERLSEKNYDWDIIIC